MFVVVCIYVVFSTSMSFAVRYGLRHETMPNGWKLFISLVLGFMWPIIFCAMLYYMVFDKIVRGTIKLLI